MMINGDQIGDQIYFFCTLLTMALVSPWAYKIDDNSFSCTLTYVQVFAIKIQAMTCALCFVHMYVLITPQTHIRHM